MNSKLYCCSFLLLAAAASLWQVSALKRAEGGPSCVDEEGNSVDWYYAYKLPVSDKSPLFKTGQAYLYLTSTDVEKSAKSPARKVRAKDANAKEASGWTLSEKKISDPDSVIMKTLSVLYSNNPEEMQYNSIMFSDQPPASEEGVRGGQSRAHAKGVVIMDDVSANGIYMTHSMPRFPFRRNEVPDFSDNVKYFGQTFMCFNFNIDEAGEQLFQHLIMMKPRVYESQLSDAIFKRIPNLGDLTLENQTSKRAGKFDDTVAESTILTRGGMKLNLFSKGNKYQADLYSGLIDGKLSTSMYVSSWRTGVGGSIGSSCPENSFHTNNIESFKLRMQDKKLDWSRRQDHSKWAISDEAERAVVCISDINRMESQYSRGGGAICAECPLCWSSFSSTIADVEPCDFQHKE